jgi:hypothetical protein
MERFYKDIKLNTLDEKQHNRLVAAFDLLTKTDVSIAKKALTLKEIKIRNVAGYDNELFPQKRLWLVDRLVIDKNTIDYIASLIVHETIHLLQYDRGVRNIDGRAERLAYTTQAKFLKKIGRPEYAKGVMEQFHNL